MKVRYANYWLKLFLILALVSFGVTMWVVFGGEFKVGTVDTLRAERAVFPKWDNETGASLMEVQHMEELGGSPTGQYKYYIIGSQNQYFGLVAEASDTAVKEAFEKLESGASAVSLVVESVSDDALQRKINQATGERQRSYQGPFSLDRSAMTQRERSRNYIIYITVGIGSALLLLALGNVLMIRRRYAKLCRLFPELATSKTFLSEAASYYDEKAKWYIYKDYFIIEKGSIYYDLNQVLWMYTVRHTTYVYGAPVVTYYGKLFNHQFKGRKFYGSVAGNDASEYYDALLGYVGQHYDTLLGMDEADRYKDMKRNRKHQG